MKQLPFNKIKMNIRLVFLAVALSVFPAQASAASPVQFEWDPDFSISITNMAPGQSTIRAFRVRNNSADSYQLYFSAAKTGGTSGPDGELLEDMMDVSMSHGTTVLAEEKLKDTYGHQINFGTIPGGEMREYVLSFTFNKDANDDYQGLSTTFNVGVNFNAVPAPEHNDGDGNGDGGDGGDGGNGDGGGDGLTATGGPGAFFRNIAQVVGATDQNGGTGDEAQVAGEDVAGLAGEDTTCQGWPLWIWVALLALFTAVFERDQIGNYHRERYGWKFVVIWTFAALVFWYYFDRCRQYQWFYYWAIILAIASHFIYLFMLKGKLRKNLIKPEQE